MSDCSGNWKHTLEYNICFGALMDFCKCWLTGLGSKISKTESIFIRVTLHGIALLM